MVLTFPFVQGWITTSWRGASRPRSTTWWTESPSWIRRRNWTSFRSCQMSCPAMSKREIWMNFQRWEEYRGVLVNTFDITLLSLWPPYSIGHWLEKALIISIVGSESPYYTHWTVIFLLNDKNSLPTAWTDTVPWHCPSAKSLNLSYNKH